MKRTIVQFLCLVLMTAASLYAAESPEPSAAQAAVHSSSTALPEALAGPVRVQPALPADPLAGALFKSPPCCDELAALCQEACDPCFGRFTCHGCGQSTCECTNICQP
jgi:hypothetical protein